MYAVLICLALLTGWFGVKRWERHRTRKALLSTPLLPEQRDIILAQVPLLQKLPPQFWPALEGKINLFLYQVDFIGCNGLDVTEEMELSIAAQACLLVVNTDHWYSHLRTILIYPTAFKSTQTSYDGYVVREEETIRAGESWSRGPVILSWSDTLRGAQNHDDGFNVVIHEFAHQLDDLSGETNGVPLLSKGQRFADWRRVVVEAFERHLENVDKGRPTVLDAYGAKAPEEFLAVSVELFFERPDALKAQEPDLYAQLSKLLALDPAGWEAG